MVIVMQEGATEEQIQHVIDRVIASGFDVHRSTGATHTVLGAVGVHRARESCGQARSSRAPPLTRFRGWAKRG